MKFQTNQLVMLIMFYAIFKDNGNIQTYLFGDRIREQWGTLR